MRYVNIEVRVELLEHWFSSYFSSGSFGYILSLPIANSTYPRSGSFSLVSLPIEFSGIGVGKSNQLCVPSYCVLEGDGEEWLRVDWLRACYEMLTCQFEWLTEVESGPIHSYSVRLSSESKVVFDHAWVNRILLFLRRWGSLNYSKGETELFGHLPKARVVLTHDVDYVKKTFSLRLKQSIFCGFNLIRSLVPFRLGFVRDAFLKALRFLFAGGDYWQFEKIVALEHRYGARSHWNIYGGKGGLFRSPKELLLDPSYFATQPQLAEILIELSGQGHTIGLHQSFNSWADPKPMEVEKKRVEQAIFTTVESCRQHWLRFSLRDTWQAQEAAGFTLDTTLGFNDRVGFRNSSALRMPAWFNSENRQSTSLEILPMVLMDSHLFDYGQLSPADRRSVILSVLDELAFVGGEATVIWHQRVFHEDYGWGDDYEFLLKAAAERGLLW